MESPQRGLQIRHCDYSTRHYARRLKQLENWVQARSTIALPLSGGRSNLNLFLFQPSPPTRTTRRRSRLTYNYLDDDDPRADDGDDDEEEAEENDKDALRAAASLRRRRSPCPT